MQYIRKRIPIRNVALALGLSVRGKAAHCWRIENHRNGDSRPSIWFTRWNRGRCHVCDEASWSNIDVVMMVMGIGTFEAVGWIAARFEVPSIPKGRHLSERQRWTPRFRVGTGDLLENFVRSGLLSELTGAEAKVLQVLIALCDHHQGVAVISYLGIMRYAGIGSFSTVRAAIKRLQSLHFLAVTPHRNDVNFRDCNEYRLTPDDPEFLSLAYDTCQRHRDEIDAQRSLRAERRKTKPT
jgi:hypothetical protein